MAPPRYNDLISPSVKKENNNNNKNMTDGMGSTTDDIVNTFAAYSDPITYEPSPSPTLVPTLEETPYPTYSFERLDEDRSNDEGTPMMRAYATIGFIIRIFLPIILILMCCRMKRRETENALRARAAGTGGGGGDGFDNETRMDPEERKRYVEEKLLTKVSLLAGRFYDRFASSKRNHAARSSVEKCHA